MMFGNGLRADIWEQFQARFKIPHIYEFYGATECPVGFANLTGKVGACGRSSPFLVSHATLIVSFYLYMYIDSVKELFCCFLGLNTSMYCLKFN